MKTYKCFKEEFNEKINSGDIVYCCHPKGVKVSTYVPTGATINSVEKTVFTKKIGMNAFVKCDGQPIFCDDVAPNVAIRCRDKPTFHGKVGSNVTVNGVLYTPPADNHADVEEKTANALPATKKASSQLSSTAAITHAAALIKGSVPELIAQAPIPVAQSVAAAVLPHLDLPRKNPIPELKINPHEVKEAGKKTSQLSSLQQQSFLNEMSTQNASRSLEQELPRNNPEVCVNENASRVENDIAEELVGPDLESDVVNEQPVGPSGLSFR